MGARAKLRLGWAWNKGEAERAPGQAGGKRERRQRAWDKKEVGGWVDRLQRGHEGKGGG